MSTVGLAQQRSCIFYEILHYLVEHPDAQDTIEGIVEWWLLEQRIKSATTEVSTALAQLIAEELVTTTVSSTGRISYQINHRKLQDIHRVLQE